MSTPEESYRALVQQYLSNGELSAEAREALGIDRMTLRLLPDDAEAIEQEVRGQASGQATLVPPAPQETIEALLSDIDQKLPPASERQPDALIQRPDANRYIAQPDSNRVNAPDPPTTIAPTSAETLSPEIRANIERLAKELDLNQTASDPKSSEPEPIEPVEPVEPAPTYDAKLKEFFDALEQNLKNKQYEAADKLTSDILLEVIQPAQGWLDAAALVDFSPQNSDKAAIQKIDQLWRDNSSKKFGFRQQLALYGEVSDAQIGQNRADDLKKAQDFSQNAGWWIKALKFYKFYAQLDFTPAEKGKSTEKEFVQLPAHWFWQLPRSKALQLGNLGFFAERGGCRVDAFTLPEFMRMLHRCGIKNAK